MAKIKSVKKHPEYKETVTLELNEAEGIIMGKWLAMMDISLKSRPTIQDDEKDIAELYLRFDRLYHKARWCTTKGCKKWKEYGL